MEHAQTAIEILQKFEFGYPFVMSALWIVGAMFFWWFEERGGPGPNQPPVLAAYPRVAVLVPCHNEEPYIVETISALLRLSYPNYQIIAVDDGSTDATGELLETLASRHTKVRILRFARNHGKAAALRAAVLHADAEYVVCIDADALLHHQALNWMVWALTRGPRVGGVTGNPRIRARSTALGRLQVGEFSCLVGLIKRAQMVWGQLFTVSGVVCGFRKKALAEVGYWRSDVLTEDVDVSWRLQLRGWQLRFEPRALCWILMPETLRGLWNQRLRWATGALQVFRHCLPQVIRTRGLLIIAVDYLTSVVWALTAFSLSVLWIVELLPGISLPVCVGGLIPGAWGLTLGTMFLLQIVVGMALDQPYEPGIWRNFPSVISYPVAFWIMMLLTVIVGIPKALRAGNGPGVWVSPDRGLGPTG